MSFVITELSYVRRMQENMKAQVEAGLGMEDVDRLKRKLATLQSLNRSICSKIQYLGSMTYSFTGRRHANASAILGDHTQIGDMIGRALTESDIISIKSTLQTIRQLISSVSSRTEGVLTDEKTVGPFKRRNII